jgi:hypothetical protein
MFEWHMRTLLDGHREDLANAQRLHKLRHALRTKDCEDSEDSYSAALLRSLFRLRLAETRNSLQRRSQEGEPC